MRARCACHPQVVRATDGGHRNGRHHDPGERLGPAGAVAEVQVNGWFEGYTQVFAGVEGDERPFRVFTLTDPPRLVVDVTD